MKIENYEGTADTFTFPYNPQSFDDSNQPNYSITNIVYKRHHILISGGGLKPKSLVLQGHLSGTNKNSEYQSLSKHFIETQKLKKLYWESDKFYLGVGQNIKKTHASERTNFIDYVANFQCIIGVLFSGTQKTYTDGGSDKTNSGNVTTYLEVVEGDVSDGTSDVVVEDNLGNKVTVSNTALSTGNTVKIYLIKMSDTGGGTFVSEYSYTTVNGTQTSKVKTATSEPLQLEAGTGVSSNISASNLDTGWTVKFRDGYSA